MMALTPFDPLYCSHTPGFLGCCIEGKTQEHSGRIDGQPWIIRNGSCRLSLQAFSVALGRSTWTDASILMLLDSYQRAGASRCDLCRQVRVWCWLPQTARIIPYRRFGVPSPHYKWPALCTCVECGTTLKACVQELAYASPITPCCRSSVPALGIGLHFCI
jgi:hypothetical protein